MHIKPNHPAFPIAEKSAGLSKLEYFAGLNWSLDEQESVTGTSIATCAAFIGISPTEYRPEIHYKTVCVKARIALALALIDEINKVSI